MISTVPSGSCTIRPVPGRRCIGSRTFWGCVHDADVAEGVLELVEREADLGRIGLDRRFAEVLAQGLGQRCLLLDQQALELAELCLAVDDGAHDTILVALTDAADGRRDLGD